MRSFRSPWRKPVRHHAATPLSCSLSTSSWRGNFVEDPLPGGVARSDSDRGAPGWVRSPISNPTRGPGGPCPSQEGTWQAFLPHHTAHPSAVAALLKGFLVVVLVLEHSRGRRRERVRCFDPLDLADGISSSSESSVF